MIEKLVDIHSIDGLKLLTKILNEVNKILMVLVNFSTLASRSLVYSDLHNNLDVA